MSSLAQVRRGQQRQGLGIRWKVAQVAFQRLNGAVGIFVCEINLAQQLRHRAAGVLALNGLQVGLGLGELPQPVVGQAAKHQRLLLVAQVLQRNQIQEIGDLGQRSLRGLGVAVLVRQQRAHVQGSRLIRA